MGKILARVVNGIKRVWRRLLSFLEDEGPGSGEAEADELQRRLLAEREACARLAALSRQAELEGKALSERRDKLQAEAVAAVDAGDDEAALTKLMDYEHVKGLAEEAASRHEGLAESARVQLEIYRARSREVAELVTRMRSLSREAVAARLERDLRAADGALDAAVARGAEPAEAAGRQRAEAEVERMLRERAGGVVAAGPGPEPAGREERARERLLALKQGPDKPN